ncbi:MAG: sigma-70 family RNA polymerase sigma factor [Myxococcota bacterium]
MFNADQYTTLSAEEEVRVSRAMRRAEASAREAICDISGVDDILQQRRRRSQKTRAILVERLIDAVEQCEQREDLTVEQRACVGRARQHLDEAEGLRWRLALSAKHIPRLEAARLSNPLMGREDLVQYGYLGLLDAAVRFDPDRGIRFTSYARWWVRAQMTRSIEHGGRSVRLPGGAVEQIRRLRSITAELESDGVAVTDQILAEESGLSTRRVRFLLSRGDVISMDDSHDEGLSLRERIPDSQPHGAADDQLATTELLGRLSHAFDDILDDREKYILRHHYGLDGLEPRSMTSIGKSLDLSRERIRQLEVRAFENLRNAI